jgi:hypothetical protein
VRLSGLPDVERILDTLASSRGAQLITPVAGNPCRIFHILDPDTGSPSDQFTTYTTYFKIRDSIILFAFSASDSLGEIIESAKAVLRELVEFEEKRARDIRELERMASL